MKVLSTFKAVAAAVAVLCLCLFAGCSSGQGDKASIPVFDVEDIMANIETVNLSEYASDIDYYPLETTENSLVNGSIINNQIAPAGDGVILYISNSSNVPMAFDHKGKFINRIGNHGRTSTEFQQVYRVLPTENGVELVDYDKIMLYDKEYNFVRSFPITFNFGDICKTDGGNYISLAANALTDKHLKVLDASGNEIFNKTIEELGIKPAPVKDETGSDEPVMLTFKAVAQKCFFFNVDGDACIYFTDNKDTVYTILESGKLAERYAVNYGKYDDGVSLNKFIFETDRFIASRFMFNFSKYPNIDKKYRFLYFIHDKSTGKSRAMKVVDDQSVEAAFSNDIDGGLPFFPSAIGNGKMYQLVSAIKFMDAAEACGSAKMKAVAATLTEESNPVLVVATLK